MDHPAKAHFVGFIAIASVALPTSVNAELPFKGAPPRPNIQASAPLSPEEQRASFSLPDGFDIELVAADPHITNVVTVAFDAAGRMWANTAVEYPVDANDDPSEAEALFSKPGRDKILVFDDPTAPGPHKPRTFASGLAIPLGMLPYQGGVIVGHGSDIVFLEDTDGDGKADSREVLLSGFGVDDSHLFPHQFTRGPNNWIYLAQGAFNYSQVTDQSGRTTRFDQCKLGRFQPDGTRFEIVGWGLNNIWGLVIDRLGHMFIQEANDLGYPVVPFEVGANYPGLGRHKAKPYAPYEPPLADFQMGGTGLSGLALAEDRDGFPDPYHDVMYVANPITQEIQAIKIHRDGSDYRLEKLPTFIKSSDPWFRPVSIHFGPDSCLYIVDWYNKIIAHNEVSRDHPDRDKSHARIWRVRHRSMEQRSVPDLTSVPVERLPLHLEGPSSWEVTRAWQEIVDRGAVEIAPELRSLARSGEEAAEVRLRALWALEGLKRARYETLEVLAGSPESELRREAARVVGTQGYSPGEILDLLEPLADDPAPKVRSQLIRSVGGLSKPGQRGIRLLLRMARPAIAGSTVRTRQGGYEVPTGDASDRAFERYLARAALEGFSEVLGRFLSREKAASVPLENRVVGFMALGNETGARLLAEALPELDRPVKAEELALLSRHLSVDTVKVRFKRLLTDGDVARPTIRALLEAESGLENSELRGLVGETLKGLLEESDSSEDHDLVIRAAKQFRIESLEKPLQRLAQSAEQSEERRLDALEALREIGSDDTAFFFGEAQARIPGHPIQREAVTGLASVQKEEAVRFLVRLWPNLTTDLRQVAVRRLTTAKAGAKALLQAIEEDHIGIHEIDRYALERLDSVLGETPALSRLKNELDTLTEPALRLNGKNDDFVDTDINLRGAFTVECWVKLDAGIGNEDGILAAPGQPGFNFHNGHFRVYWGQQRGDVIVAGQRVQSGRWVHVAVTYDGKREMQLFVNGKLDQSADVGELEEATDLDLGRTIPSSGGTSGWITELRVWDHARSADSTRVGFKRRYRPDDWPEGLAEYFSPGRTEGTLHGNARIEQVLDHPELATPEEAIAMEKRRDKFRRYAERSGDAQAGKALFKQACLICHSVDGKGGQMAPPLDGLGHRTTESLLHSIMTPNQAVEGGYYRFRVETNDGEVLDGFLVSRSSDGIVLRRMNSADREIPQSQIERAYFTDQSLMPNGLLEALKPKQISDLFTYLRTLE